MKSLVVDGNHLVHRHWHTKGTGQTLTTSAGRPSGVVHGFLSSLCHLHKVFDPIDHIYVCWDRRSRHRKRLLDNYRAKLERAAKAGDAVATSLLVDCPHQYKESRYKNRTNDDHNLFQDVLLPQMRDLEFILPNLGVRNLRISEVEGDDLIGIATDILSTHGEVVIVSADHDLYQLLSDSTRFYDPIKRKFFTKQDFEMQFEIPPARYPEIKALAGDDGDDIPGIPRVGEKTAIKLIRETADLVNLFEVCRDAPTKPVMKTIPHYEEQVRLAYDMSFILSSVDELDLDQREEFLTAWRAPAKIDWAEINAFCDAYELKSVRRELQHLFVGKQEDADLAACKSLDELFERWGDCARCPLHATRINLVRYGGSPTAKIVLCGEGPGASENILGEPFVGKAGKYLEDKCLKPNGLSRNDLHIINIVCCRPTDANGDNRAPSKEEVAACHPRLTNQLRIVDPSVVVLIGDKALKAFFPDSGRISQERGADTPMEHPDFPGCRFVAVFHPSYLMRLRPDHSDVIKSRTDWKYIAAMVDIAN